LNGLSPAEFYKSARPTEEEIREAVLWFQQEQRRQERWRLTREGRRDPVRLELLAKGLAELGIADPERRIAVALAGYSREAIVRGLATFQAKQELGTLPPDADAGRYLGGIIRQLDTRIELERTAVHLLKWRLRLADLTLVPLKHAAGRIRSEHPASDCPQAFVDRALEASYAIDFRFWSQVAVEALKEQSTIGKHSLFRTLSTRIAATFKADRERRSDLIDLLAEAVAPP
jgi:hypothetical protein